MLEDTDREISDEEVGADRITCAYIVLTKSDDNGNVSNCSDEEKVSRKEKYEEVLKKINKFENSVTADIFTISKAVDEKFVSTDYKYSSDDTAIDDAVKEAIQF